MTAPALHAITGWQADRRQALALLQHQQNLACRRGDAIAAGAYWSAAYDVAVVLRDLGSDLIHESVAMAFAHMADYRDSLRRGLQ